VFCFSREYYVAAGDIRSLFSPAFHGVQFSALWLSLAIRHVDRKKGTKTIPTYRRAISECTRLTVGECPQVNWRSPGPLLVVPSEGC
jgi:hypothetical protein